MAKKIILHLCADTGSDTKPFSDDPEYEVIKVGSDIGVENFEPPYGVYGIIANPPCLEFSRARTGGKPRNPDEGMVLVKECIRIIRTVQEFGDGNLKFWVIENPATGALRNYLGKPMEYYTEPPLPTHELSITGDTKKDFIAKLKQATIADFKAIR